MASKEDPAVQFWEFVQENLLQFHCENVSWEQASDKIPIREVITGLENQSKRVAKKTLINWSEAA